MVIRRGVGCTKEVSSIGRVCDFRTAAVLKPTRRREDSGTSSGFRKRRPWHECVNSLEKKNRKQAGLGQPSACFAVHGRAEQGDR